MDTQKSAFRLALQNSIPVMTGYIVLGTCLGILMTSQGLPAWLCPLSNLAVYAGSMEYLSVNLFVNRMDYAGLAVTTFLVNARHLFYGISMIEKYRPLGWKKYLLALLLTDETYSLVAVKTQVTDEKAYYIYVTLLDYAYWVAGGILGAVAGSALDLNLPGIDFALTALFVVIATEQWLGSDKHFSAIIGLVSTLTCLLIFGPQNFLIPAMIAIAAILTFAKRWEDKVL